MTNTKAAHKDWTIESAPQKRGHHWHAWHTNAESLGQRLG
ncbi:hypothetical protein BRPE67_CCDS10590 [Caballeronia cordobensis]|nr:hypothetical protein BRPE67_CCDS10590 [Burkholderia sp. RPE67]